MVSTSGCSGRKCVGPRRGTSATCSSATLNGVAYESPSMCLVRVRVRVRVRDRVGARVRVRVRVRAT
jgi:hypothetical protein